MPALILLAMQIVLALAAFALPLRTVNQRLVAEKRGLLAEHNQRTRAVLVRLRRCVDGGDLKEVQQLKDALTGLTLERDLLTKIPTWPWRPGMFTSFLSVALLPRPGKCPAWPRLSASCQYITLLSRSASSPSAWSPSIWARARASSKV